MERLDSFDFNKRPSRSRYTAVIDALCEEGVTAVRLERGVDFPADRRLDTVQSAIATQVRNRGRVARTYRESDDFLVVGLRANGASPARKPARRGSRKTAAA